MRYIFINYRANAKHPMVSIDDFDEFKDRDFADWKRVRSSIEHENSLVNHRLSWLFASHAFLFAAFAVVFNAWKNPNNARMGPAGSYQLLLILISTIGMFICASIQRGLWEAENQLTLLDRWWYGNEAERENVALMQATSPWRANRGAQDKKHPPIQGRPAILRPTLSRLTSYTFAPTIFMVVWLLIILFVVLEYSFLQPVASFISKNGLPLLSYVITLLVGIFVWEWVRRLIRQRG